jgi:hypothetical protein
VLGVAVGLGGSGCVGGLWWCGCGGEWVLTEKVLFDNSLGGCRFFLLKTLLRYILHA